MAFNWNFRRQPDLTNYIGAQVDPYNASRIASENMQGYRPNAAFTPGTPAEQAAAAMQGYTQNPQAGQFSVPNNMHGGMGQPDLEGYGESLQAASDAVAQAQAKEQQIANIESQIATLEKRIADNKAKLSNWTGNADKIAAIEARKINVNDPTSIWRWKEDRDNARRIANEQNKTNNSAKANALIEVTNAVDNMVVDPSMDTPTANAMLSKLADYKTMLQKNGLPTKMVDDKIAEIKGDNKKVITETSETEDDVTYEGKDREKNESKASRLLDKKNVTVQELENASKSNVSNDTKNKLLAKRDEVKAKNIQEEKDQKRENSLLGEGKFLTSEEIQFMEGRKDVKKHTDNFGNIWFTKRQL
jgi:hypothetical protein